MKDSQKHIPLLAITMGDPAGIGPEIAVKAFSCRTVHQICRPLLIGHGPTIEKAIEISNINLKIRTIYDPAEAVFQNDIINVLEIGGEQDDHVEFGKVSAAAGDYAFRAVKTAIDLAMQKKVDGTVTGPINKEAINKAGHHFSGHTEIYAHYTHTSKYAMLLADKNLRVIHVTTHVSLRQACDLVKKERIKEVIQLLHEGLRKLGYANPHIGVAGLNPHSGEGGLFGLEEIEEIIPAIQEMKDSGLWVEGPVPADALFALANGGKFDGCVAMYHDQGHIPFKVLGFEYDKAKSTMKSVKGVNITLGLPILRTSVDHGTAFEIAGRGIASPDALINAIEYAVKILNN
ncbi:MAG: 4-hydroxythreonine-4-phosphate dehydrogenase PdxA [Bacteroidota bacterium]|nr:4-hydroxythreonine-4-phosphate dehydrogenase PdxA [Bacteroidota bacterium]MDP4273513.1 4-hydroxythreonine-4-phosphate dehydrogenase PdxA [Bacteroidota bacterium]